MPFSSAAQFFEKRKEPQQQEVAGLRTNVSNLLTNCQQGCDFLSSLNERFLEEPQAKSHCLQIVAYES